MKQNVFVIDSIKMKIVESYCAENAETKAIELAKSFDQKIPIIQKIPTAKYPTRKGILTPTDFFIHFI
jgi:hypothetical protein